MMRIPQALVACTLMTVALAEAGQQASPPPREQRQSEIIAAWGTQRFVDEQLGRERGRDVLRVGSDYTLKIDDQTGDLVVIAGTGTVEGEAHDVVVAFGTGDIASTADIRGSLVLIDSNTKVAAGARVRGDLVVVGGQLAAPADFAAEGSHVVIDNHTLGGRFEGVFAWITHGLFLGRPIVPNLRWLWAAVIVFFFVYLLLNLVFEKAVGEVTDVLVNRPLSAFGVGLLVLVLIGPISVLLAVSVVGIAVVPLVLCALLVAWVIGKVAGTRWIGTSVLPSSWEGRSRSLMAFVIGFVLITAAYTVPLLGFVTWTMMGVFGLGASALAFVAAYRRENPLPVRRDVVSVPIPPVSDHPVEDSKMNLENSSFALPQPGPAVETTAPSVILSLPHASFRDRVAAGLLDLILVVLAWQLLSQIRGERAFFLSLLAYHIGFWTWKGTTIGGIICQLRVVRVDGMPVRFVDALVRGLSAIFSVVVIGLGVFWILRDPERQAWHDKIAGTYVVKVPRNWPL
jgi:uncharacterized RDD family membrane protein YckC